MCFGSKKSAAPAPAPQPKPVPINDPIQDVSPTGPRTDADTLPTPDRTTGAGTGLNLMI